MSNKITIAASLTVALLAGTALARGGNTVSGARGKLDPADVESRSGGKYKMQKIASERKQLDRLQAVCRHLDVTKDEGGNRPAYNVFLVDAAGERATDFGAMRMNRHGNAQFRFDSRKGALPEGVESVSDYDGGHIEIRNGSGTAVLSASIVFASAGSRD